MRYAEKWGDSIDIAVELALADLKLTRDQVEVTVLEEPSKGFFGIGSKLAKVRVEEKEFKPEQKKAAAEPAASVEAKKEEPRKPAEIKREEPRRPAETKREEPRRPVETKREEARKPSEEKKEDRPQRVERRVEIKKEGKQEIVIEVCGLDEGDSQPRAPYRFQREKRRDKPLRELGKDVKLTYGEARILNVRPLDLPEEASHPAKDFLEEVTGKMGLDVSVKVYAGQEILYVDIDGPDSGTIIGKRGQTLDAIQYLTSLVVNKEKEGYTRVVIDAEGYRRKREVTLEKLANRLADKAYKSGRSVRLEPMNPYERKVIHTALQSRPEVSTKSEGEEPYRRVIIEPQK